MATDVGISESCLRNRLSPPVRDLADDGVPATVMCRVLTLCRAQRHRWVAEPVAVAEHDEAWLVNALHDAHLR